MLDRTPFVVGLVSVLAVALAGPARAETVAVAVARNFAEPLDTLARQFKAASGHDVVISAGSTGMLYTQIKEGAPFEVFLAADEEHPARLAVEGLGVPASRFTYALGRLVLLSRSPDATGMDCMAFLKASTGKVAIANPSTAPYGVAARQALNALGLWAEVEPRIVMGEDIGQAFAFVDTGNAELGLVALSQVAKEPGAGAAGCRAEIAQDLLAPIAQQAILLAKGERNAAARAFLDFLKEPEAGKTIQGFGYGTAR
jgi:molybdate transport system substrate-binding protein